MNIPDKSVEAAAQAAYDDAFMAHAPKHLPRYSEEDEGVKDSWRKVARASLEAAAPLIAAQAPHLLADYYEEGNSGEGQDIALALREDAQDFAEWLIGRAPL